MLTLEPNVAYVWNPVDRAQNTYVRSGARKTLADLAPDTQQPVICTVNGEYYLRKDWPFVEVLPQTDTVVFHILPLGGGGGGDSVTPILGAVLIAIGAFTFSPTLIATGAGLLAVGLLAVQPPSPVAPVTPNPQSQSPTYNVQLQGNNARLGQALPVLYGRHIIGPDFAAQPYQFYGDNDNQYYACILSFGMMTHYRVESLLIGNTPATQFEELLTQYVGAGSVGAVPGVGALNTLSLVSPFSVSAPEPANQDLTNTEYVGPFPCCGPGLEVTQISLDIICPAGLYFATDTGTLSSKSVTVLFEYRRIDLTSGAPIASWVLLGQETITRAQNSPVRVSFDYTVPQGRYQVRVSRQDARDENARAGHMAQLGGLRARVVSTATMEPAGNYLSLQIKATNQLSGLSSRKVNLIVQRWLPTWTPGGGWAAPSATSAIAWAAADIARNTDYGLGLPDSAIDLTTLYELHLIWTAREDTFNGIFDTRVTAWEALSAVLRVGRAKPLVRNGRLTFVRDGPQTLPTAIFTQHTNIEKGSFSATHKLVDSDSVDGVEVTYYSSRTWSPQYVRFALPGVSGSPVAPLQVAMHGITGIRQAQRECAFWAAALAYRQRKVSLTTEMGGFNVPFGDVVGVVHDVTATGCAGTIIAWAGGVATSDEELTWGPGQNYAVLVERDGDLAGPYRVQPGPGARQIAFIDSPSFAPYVGTEYERTAFALGPADTWSRKIKLTSVVPSGDVVQLSGFVDDPRVYTADAAYAGTEPEGSAPPVGAPSRRAVYEPNGHPTYGTSSDAQRSPAGYYADDSFRVGGTDPAYTYQ